MRIICEGCGQPVPIPDGYRRNKIQCPSCGVIVPIPEAVRREASTAEPSRPAPAPPPPPADQEPEAIEWSPDEEKPRRPPRRTPRIEPVDDAPDDGRPPPRKAPVVEMRFPCRRCGTLVRRQGECPSCHPEKFPAPAFPINLSLDEPDEEEEDGSPYEVEGADEVKCPKCTKMLPPGSVLCVRCGFHLKKRKKVLKTYQPMDRVWETNYSLPTRIVLFVVSQVLSGALGLTGVLVADADPWVFACSSLLFAVMMAFLLGTFDRIRLTRDTRGRAELIKTWRIAFFALQPQRTVVRGFEGILSGRNQDSSFWEWLIFLFLFISGIVPALLWWYYVIHKDRFHVALARDHGYPEVLVYKGWSEMQMKEIAFTLRDASGLRFETG